jgi:hypothetical protein
MDATAWRRTDRSARVRFLARRAGTAARLRLFAVACVRRVWDRLADERSRAAVALAERLADGLCDREEPQALAVPEEEVRQALAAAEAAAREGGGAWRADAPATEAAMHAARAALWCLTGDADRSAEHAVCAVACTVPRAPRASRGWATAFLAAARKERRAQKALLDELFRDPFAPPPSLDPACLTVTVAALARAARAERVLPAGTLERDRLAVLADALEEAGCADRAILDHLRGPGPHVPGCWALGAVLGRKGPLPGVQQSLESPVSS